jgi:uncharacterized protein YndB with AHSA1/START domain
MTDLPEYVFERTFDAPRPLVWKVWTDPDLLHRWYGPNVETIIHAFDLKPGGSWLNEMKWGGNSDFSRMDFQDVSPQDRLVWHHCSTNSDWQVAPSQMMPDWPQRLLTTVTFADRGPQTDVRLTQVPIGPSAAEAACFGKMMRGMDQGWGKGYAIIDDLLAEMTG